jgi:hypothetical protein
MATFRCSAVALAVLCLACTPQEPADASAPAGTNTIARQQIDHVTPRRDFVGPAPVRLEWTAADGVDSYNITVTTEIDTLVFQQIGARGTAVDWPKEIRLEPGTYFWRIVGMKGDRSVADSGRSAFVVMSP